MSRRTTAASAATATGFAAVLIAHATGGGHATVLGSGAGSTPGPGAAGASGSSGGAGSSGGSGSNSGGAGSSGGAGASGTTSPSQVTGSATGKLEQFGYGQISVKVSVSNGRITDVSVASFNAAEAYSQQLAQQVIPSLRQEVVSAQSARISAISGATYTSEGYAASVQSALDQLKMK